MKLMIKGKEATVGMEVTDFRGDKAKLLSWREPHKPSSSGRVYVKWENGGTGESYPGVFGGEFV